MFSNKPRSCNNQNQIGNKLPNKTIEDKGHGPDHIWDKTGTDLDTDVFCLARKMRSLKLSASPNFEQVFDTTPQINKRKQVKRFGEGNQGAQEIFQTVRKSGSIDQKGA